MLKDYYKILEVTKTATIEEIKKSYRRLALKYHPDRNFGDKQAENKFKEIAEAYEILADFEKRKNYDFNYSREGSEHSSSKKDSYQNNQSKQKEEQITPLTFLVIFQEIRKKVASIERKQINQKALFDSLADLLQENNINFLRSWDDTKTNKKIIEEVLISAKRLDYKYVEPICLKLVSLSGADNETIQKIFAFSKQRKYWGYYYENRSLVHWGIFILFLFIVGALDSNNSSSSDNKNRPTTGDIYQNTTPVVPNSNNSIPDSITSNLNSSSKPTEDYSDWDKTNYSTGSSPGCYNFKARYDASIDNKLKVEVGSHTDVVIKLMNKQTHKCIRYVYIRSGDTYDISHIPEGKYFLKIAYGRDWRQKIVNGKCVGKFTDNALYEKGDKVLDFNKIDEGPITDADKKYENYKIPSYSLSLDVIESDLSNSFESNQIDEDEFND